MIKDEHVSNAEERECLENLSQGYTTIMAHGPQWKIQS